MAYGRSKAPPPSTPFEEFMATTSERLIAAKLEFVEFLRELPAAAWLRRAGARNDAIDATPLRGRIEA